MSDWDEYAGDWDADPGPRAYAAAAWDSLRAIAAGHRHQLGGAHVLDFGCGTGLLTEHLVAAGATIDALDTSTAMLAVVDRKIAERAWSGVRTLGELDAAAGPYDLVVASSVLAFVDDHPDTVRRLAQLLRDGGLLVHWDWERDVNDAADGVGFTSTEIGQALEAAGLVEIEVATAFELVVDDDVMRPLVGHGIRTRRPR